MKRLSHEGVHRGALKNRGYDWLHELLAPCPYDTSVQLASSCRQLFYVSLESIIFNRPRQPHQSSYRACACVQISQIDR
jgi:hypothetical protein